MLTGKTLILEAAAKTLSEREDTKVVFIMALGETQKSQTIIYNTNCHLTFVLFLDYENYKKKSDDILDIMYR